MASPEWNEMWAMLDGFTEEQLTAVRTVTRYIYRHAGTADNMTGIPEAMEAERQVRAINIALKEKLGY